MPGWANTTGMLLIDLALHHKKNREFRLKVACIEPSTHHRPIAKTGAAP
jgi:hypothetical protein